MARSGLDENFGSGGAGQGAAPPPSRILLVENHSRLLAFTFFVDGPEGRALPVLA